MRAAPEDSRTGIGVSILIVLFSSISAGPNLILPSPADSQEIEKECTTSLCFLFFKHQHTETLKFFVLIAKGDGFNKQAWVTRLDQSLGPGKIDAIIG